jgi:hypothetical protein
MSPGEIDALLRREPPKSILLGFEADLEKPWLAFAEEGGYKRVALGDGATLWLVP